MDEQAKKVFDTICEMLNDIDFQYDKHEDEMVITSGAKGDDIAMPFMVRVSGDRQLVSFVSMIPIEIDKSVEQNLCIALSIINLGLVDGCFVYAEGKISFKSAVTYRGMMVGKKMFEFWLLSLLTIIDEYNDKLNKIVSEHMSVDDIRKILG